MTRHRFHSFSSFLTADTGRSFFSTNCSRPGRPSCSRIARSMGWYSEGPFDNADDLKPALKRAIEQVKQGKPALIDAVCDRRNHG